MPRHRFTAHAQNDLTKIIDYTLQNWGAAQAEKYIDGLEKLAGKLAHSPALGKRRDSLKKDLLSFPYESHVLYYTNTKAGIIISRVLHQSMDIEKHLRIEKPPKETP